MNDVPPSFPKDTARRVVQRAIVKEGQRDIKAAELNTSREITRRWETPSTRIYDKHFPFLLSFSLSSLFLSSFFSSENPAHFSSFSRNLTRNCAHAILIQRVFCAYIPRESNARAGETILKNKRARCNKQWALNYLAFTRRALFTEERFYPWINVSKSNYIINNARSDRAVRFRLHRGFRVSIYLGECPRSYRARLNLEPNWPRSSPMLNI